MDSEADLKSKLNAEADNTKVVNGGGGGGGGDTNETETVTVKKLPVKEFAKLMSSPKKETFVGKFEGFFHW